MTRAPVLALAQAKATDTYQPGFCLRFTRELYGVPKVYDDAAEAWHHTKRRHTSWPPPPGVPVWWTGGHGHVAPSAGGGDVYTTDNPLEGRGEVGLCPIQTITTRWGKTYQGWSEDLNEYVIWLWSTVDLARLRAAARTEPRLPKATPSYPAGVKLTEASLYLLGLEARASSFDGWYGLGALWAYSRFQRSLGYTGSPDRPGTDADGIPGARSAAILGQRFHWKVTT